MIKEVHAWFGGSFDPVHNGHLLAAQEVLEQFQLETLHFLPCYLSPLKEKSACSTQDRLNMLELALASNKHFSLDTREVNKPGPSYSFETLTDIRETLGREVSLLWIIGWDAYLSFNLWRNWQDILSLCNLVVINRPGFSQEVPAALKNWSIGKEAIKEEITQYDYGKIVFLNTPLIEIASSTVRDKCKRGLSLRYLVPLEVELYIKENRLFLEN